MKKPNLGNIVIYNQSLYNTPTQTELRSAIITKVDDGTFLLADGTSVAGRSLKVDLIVFQPRGQNFTNLMDVPYSETSIPHTWSWLKE